LSRISLSWLLRLGIFYVQTAAASETVPWRPPITVQEAVVKEYVNAVTKEKISQTKMVDKYIENLCPFVAGITPTLIRKIPRIKEKVIDV